MSLARNTIWLAAIAALVALLWAPMGKLHAAKPKKEAPAAESAADDEKDKPADRYALPEGGSDELLKFIEDLKTFRPRTASEAFVHRGQAPRAIKAAAEKILKLEKDQTSKAYKTASGYLLESRVQAIAKATPEEQQKLVEELSSHFRDKELSTEDAQVAMNVASSLEYADKSDLAAQAYGNFGKLFAASKNEQLSDLGESFVGAARRLGLTGKEMEIHGTTVGGDEFDWKSYRGKVVLVNFWATWCPPCVREVPNVQKHYELYHDRGFDVVGISLDQDRDALDKFLEEKQIPWTTLHEKDGGGNHPTAKYYGVMGIPTVILVNKQGKVVSLQARGPELGKLLADLIGPPNPDGDKTADKDGDKSGGDKSGGDKSGGKDAGDKDAKKNDSK